MKKLLTVRTTTSNINYVAVDAIQGIIRGTDKHGTRIITNAGTIETNETDASIIKRLQSVGFEILPLPTEKKK